MLTTCIEVACGKIHGIGYGCLEVFEPPTFDRSQKLYPVELQAKLKIQIQIQVPK